MRLCMFPYSSTYLLPLLFICSFQSIVRSTYITYVLNLIYVHIFAIFRRCTYTNNLDRGNYCMRTFISNRRT
ncbi:hypothetical protein F4805DRAFT_435052 [Annulohypoxylon moriforme]|nr:hypothetical protein F4805DRAFT_435052 [Annulohypoxylon moriforme]